MARRRAAIVRWGVGRMLTLGCGARNPVDYSTQIMPRSDIADKNALLR